MYALVNRKNVVIDLIENPRFVKPQVGQNIVIGCPAEDAIGIISSDSNTHYPLASKDFTNMENAVTLVEVEAADIPEDFAPNFYCYNGNKFEYRYSLEEYKNLKQKDNREALATFLASSTITFNDKEYGVTEEDQNEIINNISQYNLQMQAGVKNPKVEWHSKHEANKEWKIGDLIALNIQITQFAYKYFKKMQDYKVRIFNATSYAEVNNITLEY